MRTRAATGPAAADSKLRCAGLVAIGFAVLWSCGRTELNIASDADARDGELPARGDAALDVIVDASIDASIEAPHDAPRDASVGVEVGVEVGVDVTTDVHIDVIDDASTCSDGSCPLSCAPGQTSCSEDGGSPFCASLQIDSNHCGTCETSCDAAHASSVFCNLGKCEIAACNADFVDCDGQVANGCECPGQVCAGTSCGKLVFVTSELYTGAMGGLDGADEKCQKLASAAGSQGNYRAWLSDNTGSPSTRFAKSSVPYVRVDGTIVANDWADLISGNLRAPIDKTEKGGAPPLGTVASQGCQSPPYPPPVWTNTAPNGLPYVAAQSCFNWTSAALPGTSTYWGAAGATDYWWAIICGGGSCSWTAPLYCFAQ